MSLEQPDAKELGFRNEVQVELARRGAGNPDNTDWYREHAGAFSEALEHVAADLPNIMEVYTRSPEVVLLRIEEEMYQVEHS